MSENYVNDDARNVEPIEVYEETDEQFDQFYEDLYEHAEEPQTLPENFDFGEDDPRDFEKVVDHEEAREKAEKWFKFAYGYAQYGAGQARVNAAGPNADLSGQTVVLKLPGWFADDELGQWEEWWFGQFEVAKETDEDGWTALCLSAIEPMSDRGEESYFRNPIDEEWLPFSLIEFAYVVEPERTEDHLVFERGLDSSDLQYERGARDEGEIEMKYIDRSSRYGPKAVLDSPFEAKDDIKALDWDQFHPDWNGDNWTIDAEAIWPAIKQLTMQGWTVSLDRNVEKQMSDDPMEEGRVPYIPRGVKDA